ncbi:nuclear transport factor 2 family protein [Enterobacter vonholyi]
MTALQTLIADPLHDENTIAAFFSPDYQQCVDGKQLDYNGFITHMKAIKSHTKRMSISFKSVVSENDKVFTHHYVNVENNRGDKSEFEVFSCFTMSSEKIICCEELTRMINGLPEDSDLGSRS